MENDNNSDIIVQIICSDKNSVHLPKFYLRRLSEFSHQLSKNIEEQWSETVNTKALMLDFCDSGEFLIFAEIFLTSKDYAHEIVPEDGLEVGLDLSSKFDSVQLLIACADYALRCLKSSPFDIGKMPIYVDLMSNLKRKNLDSIFHRFYARLYSDLCVWLLSLDLTKISIEDPILPFFKHRDQFYRFKYLALEYTYKILNRFCHDYCRMQYACKVDPFCQSCGLKCTKCDDFVCRMCGSGVEKNVVGNVALYENCKKCRKTNLDCSCIKYGTIACDYCTICQQHFLSCRCDEPKFGGDENEDFWSFFASFLTEN